MNSAWDRAFSRCIHDEAGRRTPQSLRFGLKALTTPPWAQDIGRHAHPEAIAAVLSNPAAGLIVLDLAPGAPVPMKLPPGAWALEQHTRQVKLEAGADPIETWPSHRRKQWKRAEREGMTAVPTKDVDTLIALHQASRKRKGVASDAAALEGLMTELLKEPDTQGWVVRSETGNTLAGGVFHGTDDHRCVYGFGGQFRNGTPGDTSRASVLLIGTAMRHAAMNGIGCFDFGGSADPGVDRFYGEFGAEKVEKFRLVRAARGWRLLLRLRRPDLFPR